MARSVFVYRPNHPAANERGFVDVRELEPEPERALDAPIMVDRWYEGARMLDGTDVGSRQKHRQYLKDRGLTTMDDFTNEWAKAEKERQNIRAGIMPDSKERRNEIGRILYEVEKKNARRRR